MNRVIRFLRLLNARHKVSRYTLYISLCVVVPAAISLGYADDPDRRVLAMSLAFLAMFATFVLVSVYLDEYADKVNDAMESMRDTWRESGEKQKRDAARDEIAKRHSVMYHLYYRNRDIDIDEVQSRIKRDE